MGETARLVAALRAPAAAVVATALLCIVPPAALGESPLANPDAVVESTAPPSARPTAGETPGSGDKTTTNETSDGTTTDTTTTDTTTTVSPPPVVPPPTSPQVLRGDLGAGSAARQPPARKQAEAGRACTPQRPPINRMLAIEGVIAADEGSSWTRVALFIAACFAAIALGAFLLRRVAARRRDAPAAQRGLLETASTVVAIAGTLLAIANQLVAAPPPPQAAMTVRDVLPRITHGEYARRIGADPKAIRDKLDRREVGNVVLLEVQLTGYQGKELVLQHASYSLDKNVSGTLLRGTTQKPALDRVKEDTQTAFVPIWVGYPKSRKFEAQFRLIENGRIRQLTSTGPMKGSTYRYACRHDVRAV